VCIRCHIQRPKSHFTSKGELSAKGQREKKPTSKPDLSNTWKVIEDGLNHLAFADDSQIVEAHVYKHWVLHLDRHVPCTELDVYELEPATEALAA